MEKQSDEQEDKDVIGRPGPRDVLKCRESDLPLPLVTPAYLAVHAAF
jgi:hypothetical protein